MYMRYVGGVTPWISDTPALSMRTIHAGLGSSTYERMVYAGPLLLIGSLHACLSTGFSWPTCTTHSHPRLSPASLIPPPRPQRVTRNHVAMKCYGLGLGLDTFRMVALDANFRKLEEGTAAASYARCIQLFLLLWIPYSSGASGGPCSCAAH